MLLDFFLGFPDNISGATIITIACQAKELKKELSNECSEIVVHDFWPLVAQILHLLTSNLHSMQKIGLGVGFWSGFVRSVLAFSI